MKNIFGSLAMMFVLSACVLAQGGAAPKGKSADAKMSAGGGGTSAEITKIEKDWETAMHNKDGDATSRILADNWTALNPDGSSEDKAKFVSETKNGNYAGLSLTDIKVHSFGTTAVATGKAADKTAKYAWTDVFMKQNGQWKAVASQIAIIK
jgi:ketosteroid isomerase-like protein